MTIERAIDVGSAAATFGGVTLVALATGTSMDQWLMWVLSTLVALGGAYGTFRVTTESRLRYVETRLESTATTTDIATVKGQMATLAAEGIYRREVMDRMDERLEKIADRLGVV